MYENDTQTLEQAITKMEEAIAILKRAQGRVRTETITLIQIMKYISGSGNTTWKAEDENLRAVWFRQTQQELYEEAGIWDALNELEYDEPVGCEIVVETVRDGDFYKIVNVVSWKFEEDETA